MARAVGLLALLASAVAPAGASVRPRVRAPAVRLRAATSPHARSGSEARVRASGRCYCGQVAVSMAAEPLGASICHCSTCRKLSGAPFMAMALFNAADVTVTGELVHTRTSRNVKRSRCARCYTPVRATLGAAPSQTCAVPLALVDDLVDNGEESDATDGQAGGPYARLPPAWRPLHHMYYAQRVLDVGDALPKFKASTRGEQLSTAVLPSSDASSLSE